MESFSRKQGFKYILALFVCAVIIAISTWIALSDRLFLGSALSIAGYLLLVLVVRDFSKRFVRG